MKHVNRRTFLGTAATLSATALASPVFGKNQLSALTAVDPLPAAAVQEFVKVSHSDFDRAKAILAEYPHILNAAWDWGDGDFETAIGAAGHMGHRDFALFLLENGARADIFVLTMLGETSLVQPVLEKYPNLLRSLGPHGFTLLHHAEIGGEPALPLLEFLQKMGLEDKHVQYFAK